MERGKRIFGIAMICVSLLALFSWEKFGRAHFYYDDILVLRGSVQRGSTITPDMLKVVRTDRLQIRTVQDLHSRAMDDLLSG